MLHEDGQYRDSITPAPELAEALLPKWHGITLASGNSNARRAVSPVFLSSLRLEQQCPTLSALAVDTFIGAIIEDEVKALDEFLPPIWESDWAA